MPHNEHIVMSVLKCGALICQAITVLYKWVEKEKIQQKAALKCVNLM